MKSSFPSRDLYIYRINFISIKIEIVGKEIELKNEIILKHT